MGTVINQDKIVTGSLIFKKLKFHGDKGTKSFFAIV